MPSYQHYEQVYTFAKIHPNIVTEAMVSTQDTSDVMSATGTQFVQIFKSSHDNIHQLKMFGAIDSLATSTLDTFDYADDTALRAVWTTNAAPKVLNYNDKLITYEGTSSMRISCVSSKADGNYIQKDYGSATDFSTATAANIIIRLCS